jgi:RimJ/RimL family protein N-acetyltransferase
VPTLNDVQWPQRTERLSLRPVTPDDEYDIWSYRKLPEVNEWLPSASEHLEQFHAAFIDSGKYRHTLAVEHDGRLIGDVMVRIEDGWAQVEVAAGAKEAQAEIGYSFHPDAGGTGLATEAVLSIVGLCFSAPPEGLGLHRLKAGLFADNLPSKRLLERVGMRQEGHTVRDSLHRSRGWMDGLEFAILADEWSARHTRAAGPL